MWRGSASGWTLTCGKFPHTIWKRQQAVTLCDSPGFAFALAVCKSRRAYAPVTVRHALYVQSCSASTLTGNVSLESLPRTLLTTVAFYQTLVVAHCGPIHTTRSMVSRFPLPPIQRPPCESCSCREHNKLGDICLRVWNDLPPGLRRPGLSFNLFRRSVITHLFGD